MSKVVSEVAGHRRQRGLAITTSASLGLSAGRVLSKAHRFKDNF